MTCVDVPDIEQDRLTLVDPAIDEGMQGIAPGQNSQIDEFNDTYFSVLSQRVQQSFTGTCEISDDPIDLMGIIVDFPFSMFCDLFLMIRIFIMCGAAFISFKIAVGAIGIQVN